MKTTTGLLGGVIDPLSTLYYKSINNLYSKKHERFHCSLILYNIDHHEMKSKYKNSNAWKEIPALFKKRTVNNILEFIKPIKTLCTILKTIIPKVLIPIY